MGSLNQSGRNAGMVADDGKPRSWEMRKGKEESEALPTIQSLRGRSETGKQAWKDNTDGGVLGDDLAVCQSQEALVNPRLVQLWWTDEVGRCCYRSVIEECGL